MSHSPHIPCFRLTLPKPAVLGLLTPPGQPLISVSTQSTWFSKRTVREMVEFENPDLTQPSVSSF